LNALDLDFVVFVGDLAYPSGTPEQLEKRFFAVYDRLMRHTPVYAVIGNHDAATSGARPLENAFVLPGNERWYSFDWGDVHAAVVDTTRSDRVQASWLDRDLKESPLPFRLVFGHHPPVTSGKRGPNRDVVRLFVPVLERHRVELVVTGHDHHYERSIPLGGVTYVVSGGGGAPLRPLGNSARAARAKMVHHFMLVEATAEHMKVRAIDDRGRTVDEFRLVPNHRVDARSARSE